MTLEVRHNLTGDEFVSAVATAARADGLDEVLADTLRKSLAVEPNPEPEPYIRHIVHGLDSAYVALVDSVTNVLAHWGNAFGMQKSSRTRPYLTQTQVDDLIRLLREQFRIALRITARPALPADAERRLRESGILGVNTTIRAAYDDAYVAGRLYDVLSTASSYATMREAARGVVVTRPGELSFGMVRRSVATSLMRFGDALTADLEDEVNRLNNARIAEVIERYVDGTLRSTPMNRSNLTPEEVAATETGRIISGWRALAGELRNRMLSIDAERDWHRVAATETRFAYNMGRLAEMVERGVPLVRWNVRPDACGYCKTLLLRGGVPREFPIADVQRILVETGGTNVGRTAQRIGQPGGWVATALIHPWCRCIPEVVRSD